MGNATRGRPRIEGERYPSGKRKPPVVIDPVREPVSGAIVQRKLSADAQHYRDAGYGKEATRLWMDGKLTSLELATGLRFAGIYGRFEYYNGLMRSAAAPHYIREFISEGIGPDSTGRGLDDPDAREEREQKADADFKALQEVLSAEHRSPLEALFVDDRHIGYHLPRAKTALAVLTEYFREQAESIPKKDRKRKKKKPPAIAADEITIKPVAANPSKIALRTLLAKSAPHLDDQGLEEAWNIYCALKSREDFRLEKSR